MYYADKAEKMTAGKFLLIYLKLFRNMLRFAEPYPPTLNPGSDRISGVSVLRTTPYMS